MRWLGLVLATAMTVAALAGCGGGSSESKTLTIEGKAMTKSEAIDLMAEKLPTVFNLVCKAIEVQGEEAARSSFEAGYHAAFPSEQISAGEVFEAAAERC